MDRQRVISTCACAAALAGAVWTSVAAEDHSRTSRGTTQARGSLLQMLRRARSDVSPAIQILPIEPVEDSEVETPASLPSETAIDSVARQAPPITRTVEFVRSDGVTIRRVVSTEPDLGVPGSFADELTNTERVRREEKDTSPEPVPTNSRSDEFPPPLPGVGIEAPASPHLELQRVDPSHRKPAGESLPPLPEQWPTEQQPTGQVPLDRSESADPRLSSTPPGLPVGSGDPGVVLPTDFHPWWQDLVFSKLRDSDVALPVEVGLMVCQALNNSPQVAAIQTDPMIRRTQIVQERARFDWNLFLETRYDDVSDPVGNTLTTGGPPRYRDQQWTGAAGVRQRNITGGEFELAQRFGWQDTNSRFFVPSPQRTARLELSYTQPLLHGSGRAYNESRVLLASINTNASLDEVQGQLQDHLLDVATTYWELYRARVIYLQRIQFLDQAEQIVETLQARQEIDALRQQVLRARAAAASRRSALVRAEADIRDAESRLKLLVNHPALLQTPTIEIIPDEHPTADYIPLSRTDALNVAMMHRPDISRATREIRASGVRLGVAENELLPRLDLILSSYLYGLEGDHLPKAYGSQFSEGRPSFAAGLQFEMPLGNRAALAQEDQRRWEMSRAMHEYRAIVETGMTDVDLALREVETSYLEMVARWQSMLAAQQESEYLRERWLWLGGADRHGGRTPGRVAPLAGAAGGRGGSVRVGAGTVRHLSFGSPTGTGDVDAVRSGRQTDSGDADRACAGAQREPAVL